MKNYPTFEVVDKKTGEKKKCIAMIRKLTEKECGRLMGVSDEDIEKMKNAGICRSEMYKLFGNSIVVDVLENLFRKLVIDKKNESGQLTIFDML